LAGGVPHLQFNGLAFAGDRFYLEINADSGNVIFTKNIVGESNEKAGFSGAGITDQKDFWSEKKVKLKRRSLELEKKKTNRCSPSGNYPFTLGFN
jgi:hypothetical protein